MGVEAEEIRKMDIFKKREEFDRLYSLIRDTDRGCFILARYNIPEIRQRVNEELKERLSLPFHEFYITPINKSPLQILKDRAIDPGEHSVVSFYDIEKGFPDSLGHINLQRDELAGYNCSIIFWVTDDHYRHIHENAPDFSSRVSGSFDFTIRTRQECGMLCLIDLVGFTHQSNELGNRYTQEFLDYYYRETRKIAKAHGFEWIRSIGDAVVLFGDADKTEELIDIMLDLFSKKGIKDRFGFKVSLRMVAHSGYISFWIDNEGKRTDFTGSDAIRVFRMEKEAGEEELVVTGHLFKGLAGLLKKRHIEALKRSSAEPLKGISDEPIPLYSLILPRDEEIKAGDILRYRLGELREKTQSILVLAGLYKPIDIEKNLVNLTIDIEDRHDTAIHLRGHRYSRRWLVEDRDGIAEGDEAGRGRENARFSIKEVFQRFNRGIIYGQPGGGKTTILHYFVHATFKSDRAIPIYTRCMHLPDLERWCRRKGCDPDEAAYDLELSIKYLLYGFLFPDRDKQPDALSPDDLVALQDAEREVISAWAGSRLSIYVDGLDEAPEQNRSTILAMVRTIMENIEDINPFNPPNPPLANRIFLTSRPIERYDEGCGHLFHVAPLDMKQLKELAATFYVSDPALYKGFEDLIWREEVVKKVAGTPLTGILLMAYYEAFRRIDRRYIIYDTFLKFFLLRIWEEIKETERSRRGPQTSRLKKFFREAREDDILEKHPEISGQYDCLSRLSYDCLYSSATGEPVRSIPIATIRGYIMERAGDKDAVERWLDRLIHDQMLIRSGDDEYTIIHSTVMEFLAGRWIAETILRQQDEGQKRVEFMEITRKEIRYQFETLSITAGRDLDTGYKLIRLIGEVVRKKGLSNSLPLSYRILCEVEGMEVAELKGMVTTPLYNRKERELREKGEGREWLYNALAHLFLSTDKKVLEEAKRDYPGQPRLSRPTLTERYLPIEEYFDAGSDLLSLREDILKRMVHDEIVSEYRKRWEGRKEEEIEEEIGIRIDNLLTMDTGVYHPQDKNFSYYQERVGDRLKGIFGSPNLRHDGAVSSCAFSPDARMVIS
ncbi:MAG: hypothetical protein ACE5EA_08700, partial [Nitrospirota bacterium]